MSIRASECARGREHGWTPVFVTAYLYRANPASIRWLAIPEDYTFRDLEVISALVFGLNPERIDECRPVPWPDGSGVVKDAGDTALKECLRPGDRIDLRYATAGKMSDLVVRLEITEEPVRNMARTAGQQEALPLIIAATGMDVPEEIWQMDQVSAVMSGLEGTKTFYTDGNGRMCTRDRLAFSEARTMNAIRRVFAPETARKEFNRKRTLPLRQLLEKKTVPELKDIADTFGFYLDSTFRKAEIVEWVIDHLLRRGVGNILREAPLGPTRLFVDLATREDMKPSPESVIYDCAYLYDYGLMLRDKTGVVYFASDLTEAYEKIVNNGQEEDFLRTKSCIAAINFCRYRYAVFDQELYLRVLRVLLPDMEEPLAFGLLDHITGEQEDQGIALLQPHVYRVSTLDRKQAVNIWKMSHLNKNSWYIPTEEEILRGESPNWLDHGSALYPDLLNALKRCSVQTFGNSIEWVAVELTGNLWIGNEPRAVAEYVIDRYSPWYRGSLGDKLADFLKTVSEIARIIPLAELGGHTRETCPKELLAHAASVRRNLPAQEKKWIRIKIDY